MKTASAKIEAARATGSSNAELDQLLADLADDVRFALELAEAGDGDE